MQHAFTAQMFSNIKLRLGGHRGRATPPMVAAKRHARRMQNYLVFQIFALTSQFSIAVQKVHGTRTHNANTTQAEWSQGTSNASVVRVFCLRKTTLFFPKMMIQKRAG